MIDMINAQYGLFLTADDVADLGKSVLKNEREFNAKAVFTSINRTVLKPANLLYPAWLAYYICLPEKVKLEEEI